ncbi:MAG: cyclopropane fatty-acyl-phospholipid synthase-like methyltransferase [Alphaproteobacteria bacterium]|jgi:cyclopropane fatty-acyl-phospholipid synthase-like methyltransferase
MSLVAAFKRLTSAAPATEPDTEAEAGDATDAPEGDGAGVQPLRVRLRAWWDGTSVERVLAEGARRREASAEPEENGSDEESAPSLVEVATAPAEEEIVPGGIWSQARIAVSEMLFGDGEIVPGGSQRTLDMVSSFGLSKDANVLNIGAGLGGAARAIAVEYFAWVEGFESDPALAAAGGKYNAGGKKGEKSPADKANIHHADFETLELKPNVFDGAFSRETFFRVKKKPQLIESICEGLKPSCPFLLTDYFLAPDAADRPETARWLSQEYGDVHPWTVADAEKILTEIGFEMRVSEDITEVYKADILSGFSNMVSDCEKQGIAENIIQAMLDTAGLWSARVEAMEAGVVKVHKFLALRPPEG